MILRYDQGMTTPNETPGHPLSETAAEAMTFNSDDAPDYIGFGPFIIERHAEGDHVIALRHLHHPAGVPLTVGGATRISNFLDSITAQHGGDDTVASLVAEIRDLRGQLDAERFAHANTAVKVKNVEELADRLEHEAAYKGSRGDNWDAVCLRAEAGRIRAALNGDDQ